MNRNLKKDGCANHNYERACGFQICVTILRKIQVCIKERECYTIDKMLMEADKEIQFVDAVDSKGESLIQPAGHKVPS